MKKMFTLACMLILAAGAFAQQRTDRTEVVVKHEYNYSSYYEMRFGFWFPKDHEQQFTADGITYDKTKSEIDQSQAFGLDFHLRRDINELIYLDFALQAWYSSYAFKFNEISTDNIRDADSWALLIPVTGGLSVAPLVDSPIQPYAMAGVGAYFGISGLQRTTYADKTTHDKNLQKVAFGGYFGAGLDILLTHKFGISIAGKYTLVKFSEPMYTQQQDFTGLQLMVGFVTAM